MSAILFNLGYIGVGFVLTLFLFYRLSRTDSLSSIRERFVKKPDPIIEEDEPVVYETQNNGLLGAPIVQLVIAVFIVLILVSIPFSSMPTGEGFNQTASFSQPFNPVTIALENLPLFVAPFVFAYRLINRKEVDKVE